MSNWFAGRCVHMAIVVATLALIGAATLLWMLRAPDADDELALAGQEIGMKLVWIEPGSFQMGSANDEFAREADEVPQRKESIPEGFYIGAYEVTQREWGSVMRSNPSTFNDPERPVEGVSYCDALLFCEKLSELTCRKVRLPEEREWEYACRAGKTTPYSFGVTLTPEQANFGSELGSQPSRERRRSQGTTRVGKYLPNAWGLYDVHGNVWEWCQDSYRGVVPKSDDTESGTGRVEDLRVARGGAWLFGANDCRSASRTGYPATTRASFVGFRVVVEE